MTHAVTHIGGHEIDRTDAARRRCSRDAWPRIKKLEQSGQDPPLVDGVVTPNSPEAVAAILAEGAARGTALLPVGLRSGICGGIAPLGDEIAIDLSALNRIEEIDEQSLWVRTQAGVCGRDLENALRPRRLTLGHFPQSLHISSVGGWIATRSTGLASTRYGGIEQQLLSLKVALPDGTLVETPCWPRASVGPDLAQLFVGSEGAFGVICAATLRIRRQPQARLLEAWEVPSFTDGLDAIRDCLADGLVPAVVRLYNADEAIRFSQQGVESLLILAHEGLPQLVDCERALVAERLRSRGGIALDDSPAKAWWTHRYDASALLQYSDRPGGVADAIEVAADWTRIHRLVERLEHALRPSCTTFHMHASHFYAQGASAYLIVYLDGEDSAEAVRLYDAAWAAAMQICIDEGAAISHHHGIGRVRAQWLAPSLGSATPLLQRVRDAINHEGTLSIGHLDPVHVR